MAALVLSLRLNPLLVFLLLLVGYTHGACTYSAISTDLNTCAAAATSSSTVKWFFPHGTIGEQAEFCQSGAQSTLTTCINTIFSACKLEAKSIKMFSTTGDNLVNAYTKLCAATLVNEAHACMSVVSATATFTTAETSFATSVTALPDAATSIEICGLATTMKYVAYTTLLSATCSDATHLAVWSSFYSTVLDSYACTCSSVSCTCHLNHVAICMTLLVAGYFNCLSRN